MKMEPKWVWVGIMVVLFVSTEVCWWRTEGCLEQERSALLKLKHYFNSPLTLQTWVQENSDCCEWERVYCYDTKRVVELDLSDTRSNYLADWYLNTSLFSPFKELEVLHLTDNSIAGCVENEGFDKLSNLSSLWFLDLSGNKLKGSFDALGLCELVQLQNLYIQDNYFVGSLPWCLANLTSLQVLDILTNHFNGNISSSPLASMTWIRSLSLGENQLQIPISLEPFFNHSELKTIFAWSNKLYAQPESHILSPKFQLETIGLSGCRDSGNFPKFLYHQQALRSVYLYQLNLKGEFPTWLLDNNTELEVLDLTNNTLSGLLQFKNHVHMNLTELLISTNFFHGHIPAEVGAHLPSLIVLNLSSNAFDGNIPSCLGDMKSLQLLDLSNNHLSGGIPEHLAVGCFSLEFLALSNNRLQGQIFSSKFNLTNLLRLQLDGNNFTGSILDSLSNCSLTELSLSDNHLSGKIPGFLGNMSKLYHLIIDNNHLEGPIPTEFCQLSTLEVLDLSENNISGSLPSCFSPSLIQQVHLSKNRLQGQLNDALRDTVYLSILDLSYNNLNGSIPSWIAKLSTLRYLKLSHNYFEGGVPFQLCVLDQLQLLDLSHNNFFGQIPPCLVITAPLSSYSMEYYSSYFEPNEPRMINEGYLDFVTKAISYSYRGKILTYMAGIDLSCNKLTGEIPHQIGQLDSIRALNLSHNKLTGPIPSTLSKLKQIESLDLSYNNLNGRIPLELVELNALAVFSVSHNNLSGMLPDRTAQFITFGEGSYEGNPFLCGPPLPKSCNANGGQTLPPGALVDNGENSRFIDMDIFYISFTVAYLFAIFVVALVLYINPYWRQTWFSLVETSYYFIVDHLPKFV